MPASKKARTKGTTYRLVQRSYEDEDFGPNNQAVWVNESEYFRNTHGANRNGAAGGGGEMMVDMEYDGFTGGFDTGDFPENGEGTTERNRRRVRFEMDASAPAARAHPYQGGQRGDGGDDEEYEEGEWEDDDEEEYEEYEEGEWEDEEEEGEGGTHDEAPAALRPQAARSAPPTASSSPAAVFSASQAPAKPAIRRPAHAVAAAVAAHGKAEPKEGEKEGEGDYDRDDNDEDGSDEVGEKRNEEGVITDVNDDRLFEDEVQGEVTDDFLQQLIFGDAPHSGGGGGGDEDDGDDFFGRDDDDDNGDIDDEDGELWRLLTEEEKAAIRATRDRGTARRRKVVKSAGDGTGAVPLTVDGEAYPTHDTTQRSLDRQFTEMMREFNVDARINDAYTDDPRTHGALPMDKYMAALEEFVVDRAGVDMETTEPSKNKGLIQQLKLLTHRAGVFDTDHKGGVFLTTLMPDKQARFAEEFQRETERIRDEARRRIIIRAAKERLREQQASAAAAAVVGNEEGVTTTPSASPAVALPSGDVTTAVGSDPEKEEDEEDFIIKEVKTVADRLDCETAVSAYSTYFNQPNVIKAPPTSALKRRKAGQAMKKKTGRTYAAAAATDSSENRSGGKNCEEDEHVDKAAKPVPPGELGGHEHVKPAVASSSADVHETQSDVDSSEDDGVDVGNSKGAVPNVRVKGETKEEKKARRQAVKAAQRERRMEKSALKKAYREVEGDEAKRAATSQAARRTARLV